MPRLKLNPLKKYSFSIELTVRITDLNYGGHLANDRLLSMVHEARFAFLAEHGFTEKDFGGCSLILGDTAVVYHNEAFAGDILLFEVSAAETSRCGFRLFFRISRENDQALVALVENGMVCFDYQSSKIQELPEEIKYSLLA